MKNINLTIFFIMALVNILSADPRGGSYWYAPGGAPGINGVVHDIEFLGDNLYACGYFSQINGVQAGSIAKFNGASWSSVGGATHFDGSALIYSMASSNGKLYAAGKFDSIAGVPAKSIAVWNGVSWSALGVGVQGGSNTQGIINAIFARNDSVFVVGDFDFAGGLLTGSAAVWDGDSWGPVGSNMFVELYAITGDAGNIYIGGSFSSIGGISANNVVKWNGSTFTSLGSGVTGGVVRTLEVYGGDVYVGGDFNTAGGSSTNRFAVWNGIAWFNLGSGFDDRVNDIEVLGDSIFVSGNFKHVNNEYRNGIAMWNGSQWTSMSSGLDSGNGVTMEIKGNLYVGGSLFSAGGTIIGGIGGWMMPPQKPGALTASVPEAGEIRLNWFDSSFNETGYIVERAINSPVWEILDTLGIGDTTYLDAGLTPGDNYFYRVAAYNPLGLSQYSNIVNVLLTGITTTSEIPKNFELYQNYPNPFNPETSINYSIPKASDVKLAIYNSIGQEIERIVNMKQNAGNYRYIWNAAGYPSGIYFYRIEAGDFVSVKKMLLIK